MKKLEEFAKNQEWLETLRFYAFRFITDGVSPNEKVIVTHYQLDDSRHATQPQLVIVESDKRYPPYKGMTRANLVELPEGTTLGKLSNYRPPNADAGIPSTKDTTTDPRHWKFGIPEHPVFDPTTKTLYGVPEKDWLDVFIAIERASEEYSAEELVIVNKVLTRLEAKKPLQP